MKRYRLWDYAQQDKTIEADAVDFEGQFVVFRKLNIDGDWKLVAAFNARGVRSVYPIS